MESLVVMDFFINLLDEMTLIINGFGLNLFNELG